MAIQFSDLVFHITSVRVSDSTTQKQIIQHVSFNTEYKDPVSGDLVSHRCALPIPAPTANFIPFSALTEADVIAFASLAVSMNTKYVDHILGELQKQLNQKSTNEQSIDNDKAPWAPVTPVV